ncbi:uncharacterized protein LOC124341346 [Daphnia pulicaria]|uniref:uncharacterized protein LOC124341346 n=1 Tax=Daphnia pulicaria TaxID=35523 RepID=UPI001EE9B6C4|nr:uncharacterized protein LOC124341346 [Daphnia pulicaria]
MKFFVLFLSVSFAVVEAQYQPYYEDSLYQYANYPISDGRTPNLGFDHRLYLRTSTTTATTTTTTTCTVATGVACVGGRRRRFLEEDDSIEPSPVDKVEITPLVEMESAPKITRKAEPQYAFWRGGFEHPPSPYEIRSTFGQSLNYPTNYNPYLRQPIIVADTRFLLNYYAFTTTTTSTATTTFRSTPICSATSGFQPC